MGAPHAPTPPPVPAYIPPKNSITTGTAGPQYKKGETPPGANTGFQILAVRPAVVPGAPTITGGGSGTQPGPRVPPGDKAGATPGADATRGLLRSKGGPGRTLLG